MDEQNLRQLGRAARAEVEQGIDIDSAWGEHAHQLRGTTVVASAPAERRSPSRLLVPAIAAALAVVVAGIAIVIARGDDAIQTGEAPLTAPSSTTPGDASRGPVTPPLTVPVSTTGPASTPATTTTLATTTTSTTTTTTTPPTASGPQLSVSFRNPPAPAGVVPLGQFTYAQPGTAGVPLLLCESAAVFSQASALGVVTFDGTLTHFGDSEATPLACGPGNVAYGIVTDTVELRSKAVAVALDGGRAGEIVAESDWFDINTYLELPIVAWGQGPGGVTDLLRQPGRTLLGYVDADGQPVDWPDAPPRVAVRDAETNGVSDGVMTWDLQVERDPTAGSTFVGDNAVAPGPGGTYVWKTEIGAALDPTSDFADSALPVIAVLRPDGSGEWLSIPVGWRFESASPYGVLVSRAGVPSGDSFARQLALLDLGEIDGWTGERMFAADGTVTLSELNEYITEQRPAWAYDIEQLADVAAGGLVDDEQRTVTVGPDRSTATVTTSFHADDSVFATRIDLELAPGSEPGTTIVVAAHWTQSCQPGRGHEQFTIEPCV